MNKDPGAVLIDRAVEHLKARGLKVIELATPQGLVDTRADAWLRIGRGTETIDYLVEVKRNLTAATVGATLAQLRDQGTAADRPPLLVTEYVTPPLAEALRNHHQQFADAAGNMYLEGAGLLVYIVGQKPLPAAGGRARTGQMFTTNGLKVLFALLCAPELANRPHRAIAAAAGVALGAVPGVLRDLQEAGHLLVAEKNRRLNATKRLLDEWAFAYAHRLRPKTKLGTYKAPTFATWKEWPIDPEQALWGGEPAANLLVRHLKPAVLTLYGEKLPPQLMIEQRLVLAGPTEPPYLELRKPFWGKTLKADAAETIVPPVLVYADLLATGDARCIETARMIHDAYLARLLPAA